MPRLRRTASDCLCAFQAARCCDQQPLHQSRLELHNGRRNTEEAEQRINTKSFHNLQLELTTPLLKSVYERGLDVFEKIYDIELLGVPSKDCATHFLTGGLDLDNDWPLLLTGLAELRKLWTDARTKHNFLMQQSTVCLSELFKANVAQDELMRRIAFLNSAIRERDAVMSDSGFFPALRLAHIAIKELELKLGKSTVANDKKDSKIQSLIEQRDQLETLNFSQKDQIRRLETQVALLEAKTKKDEIKFTENCRQIDELRYENLQLNTNIVDYGQKETHMRDEITKLAAELSFLQTESAMQKEKTKKLLASSEQAAKSYKALVSSVEKDKTLSKALSEKLKNTTTHTDTLQFKLMQLKQSEANLQSLSDAQQETIEKYKSTLSAKEKEVKRLSERLSEQRKSYETIILQREEDIWRLNQRLRLYMESIETRIKKDSHSETESPKMRAVSQMEANESLDDTAAPSSPEDSISTESFKAEGDAGPQETQTNVDRSRKVEQLQSVISNLQAQQYDPRMIALRDAELELSHLVSDLHERECALETSMCCPQCGKLAEDPKVLAPCGHTLCSNCAFVVRNENFNMQVCLECGETAGTRTLFANLLAASIIQVIKSRQPVLTALDAWISKIKNENTNKAKNDYFDRK